MLIIAVAALCSLAAHCVTARKAPHIQTCYCNNGISSSASNAETGVRIITAVVNLGSSESLGERGSKQSDDAPAHELLLQEVYKKRMPVRNVFDNEDIMRDWLLDQAALAYLQSRESRGKRESEKNDDAPEGDLPPPEETGSFEYVKRSTISNITWNCHNIQNTVQRLQCSKAALVYLKSSRSPGKRDNQKSDDAPEDDLLPPEETGSFETCYCNNGISSSASNAETGVRIITAVVNLGSSESLGERGSQQSDVMSADELLPPDEVGSYKTPDWQHNSGKNQNDLLDIMCKKVMKEFLQSSGSPGKRDSQKSDDASEDDLLPPEETGSFEKSNCSVQLGGHCLTESLDRAANQYYYLKSPNSPGRRRWGVSASFQKQTKQCM